MIADNLLMLRKKAGLSQEQLAEKLNVTRQAISKWESGQSLPDLEMAVRLSGIFGITVDELVNGLRHRGKPKDNETLYVIFSFIGLCIMWLSGISLIIVSCIVGYCGDVVTILMFTLVFVPPIVFVLMLRRNRKKNRKT